MKRTIAVILTLMLCLVSFVGCKNKQTAAPGANAGTTQTAGNLTVLVPAGWNLIADETNPDQVYLCKGGTDLSKNAYIKLTGNSALPAEGTCTDVQPLEARTYGSLSWSGFSGSKPSGNVLYLLTQTQNGNILATVWYTQESGGLSVDDQDVQAILASVSCAAPAASNPDIPEPIPSDPASLAGDWSGTLEITDGSGDFESQNGTTYACIARFPAGENAPYIGLDQAGAIFTSFTPSSEELPATISGSWQGYSFNDMSMDLYEDKLYITIAINTDSGNALLVSVMRPLTGSSFEALAAQYGCTDYPGK